ncbi:hypothetical protein D3C87_1544990 [compost metagenome]
MGVVGIGVVGGITGTGVTTVSEFVSSALQLKRNIERITGTICLKCGFIIL